MLATAKPVSKQEAAKPAALADRNSRPVKMSYKETQELEKLPQEIEALEQEQAALQEKLLDPNIYRNAPLDAAAWQARIDEIDVLVLEKMARWEALEAKQLGNS
ncbi:ABC transporter C-terminal domain-containing protein [Chitinimonas sp. PSY-7]|uniref:ABC transporter C-terminal domain-containing protein n=1 Tax=Chitinimonas sp. PSY-7 TaxID=3459088 RepID=UPI00403FD269